jgi:hypothetical protein
MSRSDRAVLLKAGRKLEHDAMQEEVFARHMARSPRWEPETVGYTAASAGRLARKLLQWELAAPSLALPDPLADGRDTAAARLRRLTGGLREC